jgi:predicted amidohydrolase
MIDKDAKIGRRDLLQFGAAGAAGLAGLAVIDPALAQPAPTQPAGKPADTAKSADAISLHTDGTYDSVPLRKPAFRLGVCQTRVRAVDAKTPKPGLRDNLKHMLDMIDAAQDNLSGPRDILLFHEFPITGYGSHWNRTDVLRLAIDIPGEETEAIAAKAKLYGSYIVFGSYAKDKDWPNHVLSITTTIAPSGEIVGRHWKVRNIKDLWPTMELFTSTVYDNLDRFVEMYGWDAVVPIIKTDLGNFSTTSTQREPELPRAMAMKGCEVLLRTATGGFSKVDMQATSQYNGIYTAVANNAVSPDNPGYFAGGGFGGSCIYDARGNLMAEADADNSEQIVTATIPIAEYRRTHRQPIVHMDLYRPVFDRYVNKYPSNLFGAYLPVDAMDSKRYQADKSRWK